MHPLIYFSGFVPNDNGTLAGVPVLGSDCLNHLPAYIYACPNIRFCGD